MKKIILIIVLVLLIGGVFAYLQRSNDKVASFEECVAAGNPVMESYPRQCRHGDDTFTEIIPNPVDTEAGGFTDDTSSTNDSSASGILPFKSGVMGRVLLGPTCPVMQDPPDLKCGPKPYQTTVQVIVIGSEKSSPFATVKSDEEGSYRVFLPPGEYGLQPVGGQLLPRCETKNITVEPDVMMELDLYCDSGIR